MCAPVAGAAELLRARRLVRDVPAADNVVDYATRLVRATRPGGEAPLPASVARWVRWGAGPRAGQALVLAAKARAVVQGRPAVSLDDIRAVAPPVLRHRVLVNFQAVAEGITAERVVQDVLADVPDAPLGRAAWPRPICSAAPRSPRSATSRCGAGAGGRPAPRPPRRPARRRRA